MMCNLPDVLAAYRGAGYLVAPAGYGKTHLIAQSAALSDGRQLILTHTYAGVGALRRKMRALRVSDKLFRIDTVASWSLRLALSYSGSSGWTDERPADNERWNALYEACAGLLDHSFIRRIIRASYSGLYVDEYQDCSVAQHGIVLKLARDLPSRILGDPLQGIFDFDGQNLVNWGRDVEQDFQRLGTLEVPHRWEKSGARDLGIWLRGVRACLERGRPVNLNADLPASVRLVPSSSNPQFLLQSQGKVCRYFKCDRSQSVIAIHKGSQEYKAKCHALSRNLGGVFSSIEEVEGKDLFSFVRKLARTQAGAESLQEAVVFAKRCMTAVEDNLPAGTVRGEHVKIRANTRNPEAAEKGNAYLVDPSSAAMVEFFRSLAATSGVAVVRADLFYRALSVLSKHALYPELSLTEAAEKYQGEFRYRGRPVGRRRLIGTTLLVKGLEFDHAIVLDGPSLSKKELYVALTRGARSVTIVSSQSILNPN